MVTRNGIDINCPCLSNTAHQMLFIATSFWWVRIRQGPGQVILSSNACTPYARCRELPQVTHSLGCCDLIGQLAGHFQDWFSAPLTFNVHIESITGLDLPRMEGVSNRSMVAATTLSSLNELLL